MEPVETSRKTVLQRSLSNRYAQNRQRKILNSAFGMAMLPTLIPEFTREFDPEGQNVALQDLSNQINNAYSKVPRPIWDAMNIGFRVTSPSMAYLADEFYNPQATSEYASGESDGLRADLERRGLVSFVDEPPLSDAEKNKRPNYIPGQSMTVDADVSHPGAIHALNKAYERGTLPSKYQQIYDARRRQILERIYGKPTQGQFQGEPQLDPLARMIYDAMNYGKK
jgi:hypothetical protein